MNWWPRYKPPSQRARELAERWCRLYKRDTISDYNIAAWAFAKRVSGTPSATYNAICAKIRIRRQHRRLFLYGEVPKYLSRRSDYMTTLNVYHYIDIVARERLERWRKEKRQRDLERERRRECTCEKCGAYSPERKRGFMNITIRCDCRMPPLKRFQSDDLSGYRDPVLCVSCWNKTRPMYRAAWEAAELLSLISKTKREMKNAQRKHDSVNPGSAG